jgi:hypothetical protein
MPWTIKRKRLDRGPTVREGAHSIYHGAQSAATGFKVTGPAKEGAQSTNHCSPEWHDVWLVKCRAAPDVPAFGTSRPLPYGRASVQLLGLYPPTTSSIHPMMSAVTCSRLVSFSIS